jgi:hypothetical protein
MPHTVPDDLAVRKVRESDDRTFILRIRAAVTERLRELDRKDAEAEKSKRGTYQPLGVDVEANPGTNFGQ